MIVTFDGFKEKQKEVEEYKKSILKLIDEFVTTDEDFKRNHTMGKPYKYAIDFYIDYQRRGDFVVNYRWGEPFGRTDQIYFSDLEHQRLKEFMKEPELYRNKNKFNI